MNKNKSAVFFALLAAALYAVNIPISKLMLEADFVSPAMLAGLLYLGAGLGMGITGCVNIIRKGSGNTTPADKRDYPFIVGMVLLDIAAPVFLMMGISLTNSANVSLLNNFEIVATSLIALAAFGERISGRLWASIVLVVISAAILGFEGSEAFVFNTGSVYVLLASVCWGFENNCTASIKSISTQKIVVIKGFFSGAGGIAAAFIIGEGLPKPIFIAAAMVLGYVAYGLSINLYVKAQRALGAAKTSAFYSAAPFLGVGFSVLLVGERPGPRFYIALAIMAAAVIIMVRDTLFCDVQREKE